MRVVATVYYSENGWIIDMPNDMLPNDLPRTYVNEDRTWIVNALNTRLTQIEALP